MIPKDRPVIWQDIEDLRIRWNLTHNALCAFLGILANNWTQIRSKPHGLEEVVGEVSLAILVRIYDEYPSLAPNAELPDMRQVYEDMNAQKLAEFEKTGEGDGEKIKKRHFSVKFGRNSSAGYAWIEKQVIPRAVIARIVDIFTTHKGQINADKVLTRLSKLEAKVRGVDPYKTGQWKNPTED